MSVDMTRPGQVFWISHGRPRIMLENLAGFCKQAVGTQCHVEERSGSQDLL